MLDWIILAHSLLIVFVLAHVWRLVCRLSEFRTRVALLESDAYGPAQIQGLIRDINDGLTEGGNHA